MRRIEAEAYMRERFHEQEAWRKSHCSTSSNNVCASGHAATLSSLMRCVRCVAAQENVTALAHGLRAARRADSLWLEFGAWSGRTARLIRDASFERVSEVRPESNPGVHSFDSFQGLPEDWRIDPLNRSWARKQFLSRGSFSRRGRPPFFESGIHWHVGWFNATLPAFLETHRTPISFVHIDCDLYSSTASVLEALEPRLTDDAVLALDELINYPEYREHEARALVEFLRRTGRGYRILGVGPSLILPNETDILHTLMLARHFPVESRMPFGPGSHSNEDVAIQLMGRGVR